VAAQQAAICPRDLFLALWLYAPLRMQPVFFQTRHHAQALSAEGCAETLPLAI